MTLLDLFQWLGHTALGVFMQQSTYAFAVVEMIHLLALALLGGVILIVNLRALGFGLRSQTPAGLAQQLRPFLLGSIAIVGISGILLLSEEPIKCYFNPAFRLKMLLLSLALLFYFAIQQRVLLAQPARGASLLAKFTSVVSLLLWLSVGLAGRAVGFI
jgi:uncharacterized protein DUF6644